MPKCSIIGCNSRQSLNRKEISLHRLPRNATKKKMWLDIIGTENINFMIKDIFVCSLHFDNASFNKTLDIIRLRDDAVPSQLLLPHSNPEDTAVITENEKEITPSLIRPISITDHSAFWEEASNESCTESLSSTSDKKDQIIKKLKQRCYSQRKRIKRLNEILRRQKRKIVNFTNIIRILTKQSS